MGLTSGGQKQLLLRSRQEVKEEGEKWVYRLLFFFFFFYRDEKLFINLYGLLLLERAASVLAGCKALISELGVLRIK